MSVYWEGDGIRLHLGDCREVTDWLKADVLVTDPPYGIGWKLGSHPKRMSVAHAGILNDQDTSCRDDALEMWGDKPGVVFGTWAAGYPDHRQILVWRKPVDAGVVGSVTGFRRDTELIFLTGTWPKRDSRWSSVFITNSNKNAYLRQSGHPHGKPVGLMRQLIEASPDGIIADPFAGGGSTLVAAKELGVRAIGVELHEPYAEAAARRLDQGVLDFGDAS